jgi:hypothetical protein
MILKPAPVKARSQKATDIWLGLLFYAFVDHGELDVDAVSSPA